MKQEDRVRDYFTRDARRFDRVYAAGRQQTGVQRLVDAFFRRRELRQRVGACVQAVGEAGRVLEIGSGSGRVAVALVQAGVRHITGIDLSQEMCRLAQGLAEQAGLADRCEFLVGSAEAFEAEEPFDAVVVLGLMDYVADAPAMLARTKRLSRRRVVVSFPRRGMLLNLPRRLWLKTKRCPVHFYGRRRIEEMFREAGLDLVDLVRIGFPPAIGSYVAIGVVPEQT